jgi:hypothetical protein
MQATQALTFVVGSALAGVVCNRFGPAWALGLDALSFAFSAFNLSRIVFRGADCFSSHVTAFFARSRFFKRASRFWEALASAESSMASVGAVLGAVAASRNIGAARASTCIGIGLAILCVLASCSPLVRRN